MGLKYQTPSFVTLAACGCVVAVMYGVSYTRCPRNTVMGVYSGGNNLVRVLYPRGATWAPCNAAGQHPRDNIFVWPIVNKCRSLCMDPITVDVSISTFTLCAKHVQAKGSFTVAVGLSPSARLKSSDSEFDKSCQMALQKLALTRPSARSERGHIVSEMAPLIKKELEDLVPAFDADTIWSDDSNSNQRRKRTRTRTRRKRTRTRRTMMDVLLHDVLAKSGLHVS